jgi:hypothetical protein
VDDARDYEPVLTASGSEEIPAFEDRVRAYGTPFFRKYPVEGSLSSP